jgi:ATP-binding cassette subfamily C protein CydD
MKFHRGLNREFFQNPRELRKDLVLTAAISILVILQSFFLGQTLNQAFFGEDTLSLGVLSILFCIVLTRAGLQFLREQNANQLALSVSSALRTKIVNHLFLLKGHLPKEIPPAILSSLQDAKADSVEPYFRTYLPSLITAAISPALIVLFVFWTDPLSGIVLLFTGPLIPFFAILIGTMASNAAQKQWFHMERLSKHFSDLVRGWDTLRLFRAENQTHAAILKSGLAYREATLKVLKIAFLSAFSLEFVATISTAILAVEIGLRVLYNRMDYLPAITILVVAPEFYMPLRNLGGAFHASLSGIEAMNAIQEFLKILPPKQESKSEQTALTQDWKTLHLENITAAYPDSEQNVLENISLSIQKNDKIALTGVSGSGKSTFCHILMQNIHPKQGKILLDTTPASEFHENEWNSLFSTIPQRPALSANSLYDNIVLGRHDITQEEFWMACQQAGLDDVIKRLPNREHTFLGENGITLSTGQSHRVALARTFLSKSPIVILDEPTAHLDFETEKIVHDGIIKLAKERTVIIISHRESTIALCNRKFKFAQGSITESSAKECL